jgi:hypothetical protein
MHLERRGNTASDVSGGLVDDSLLASAATRNALEGS